MIKATSVKIKGHRCFKNNWAEFSSLSPINIIIGRNNTGKSHLLDFVETLCTKTIPIKGWQFSFCGELDEKSLKRVFQEGVSQGELMGNHWEHHGRLFIGVKIKWDIDENGDLQNLSFPKDFDYESGFGKRSTNARINEIKKIVQDVYHELSNKQFVRLLADRDIRPEEPNNIMILSSNGAGATNIIRRYIVTSNPQIPRALIQMDLLAALNEIFGEDGKFTEIQVKQHDDESNEKLKGTWEIYLGEEKKGLIPLSNSGSGLKTVFLVLLNLLVIPAIAKINGPQYVFAFEELENNLHPALLRRLFKYLEKFATANKMIIFLTTHSSVALDTFGLSKNAKFFHVTHDGESATVKVISAHFDKVGIVTELGSRPSDLLQSNGVIWVEGPSDRVYLNKWISLFSDGKFKEGRDYQCAFYGGALLAKTQFVEPNQTDIELVDLLSINPNIIVVCDGDRHAHRARLKKRVMRIRNEVSNIPGAYIWITEGREIENYQTGYVLGKAFGLNNLPDPTKYDSFFAEKSKNTSSYAEKYLHRKSVDKVDLAIQTTPHMLKEHFSHRFDIKTNMDQIVLRISKWNS